MTTAFSRRPRALLALLAPFAAGCATIFTGQSDVLRFDANVPGVRLTIDGQYRGELPLSVEVSRNFMGGRQFWARFEREGYQPQEFTLGREFNPVAILDVSSPLTSGGVDVLTGSLMRFSPQEYRVQMLPSGASATAPAFRREVERTRFALHEHWALQRDLARGGGERLDAFVALLGEGDPAGEARARGALLAAARDLVAAPDAPAFAAGIDATLGACR